MLAACTGAGFAWGSSAVSFVAAMYNKRQLHEQPHEQPDVGSGGAASQHLRSNRVNCLGSRHLGWNRSRLRSRIRTSISLSRCSGGSSPLIMLHKGRMSADGCECGLVMCYSFRHPAFIPPSKRYGSDCIMCCLLYKIHSTTYIRDVSANTGRVKVSKKPRPGQYVCGLLNFKNTGR